MKAIRIIAIALVLSFIGCFFISCDDVNLEEIVLPERDFYDITVSFQIADSEGVLLHDVVDYNYKGHETPTILNIISDYLYIEADEKCVIDNGTTLVQVGGKSTAKANINNGDYWAFAVGIGHNLTNILADQNLQNKTFVNDQRMCDYIVEDGSSFTIVLVKG